jgi:hypothetical protein
MDDDPDDANQFRGATVGAFLLEICRDLVALVCGLGALILCAIGAFISYSWSPPVFFPMAYACLFVAAYRVWAKQMRANETLKAQLSRRGPSEAKKEELQQQLESLGRPERLFLQWLLRTGRANDLQIKDYCSRNRFSGIDPNVLASRVTFLGRDSVTGGWFVIESMVKPLSDILVDESI